MTNTIYGNGVTKMALLEIKNLKVAVEDKTILNGVDLKIEPGEIHVLMGQNGVGKSTLVSAVMGDPSYEVEEGQILFEGEDITDASPDERARKGIFMSFQNPLEIPGVTVENFLRTARGSIRGTKEKIVAFRRELEEKMDALGMDHAYADRYLNVGFSGGEKKKAEILQLLMLQPKLAFLDETDSGLDVDAVKTVTEGIKHFHNKENSLVIITHNASILDGLDVDKVHVIGKGKILKTGDRSLIDRINEFGYASVTEEV